MGALENQTEAAKQESGARYRSLFDNSMDAIILASPDGHVIAANPAACSLFGMTVEEIRCTRPFGLIAEKDVHLVNYLNERGKTGKGRAELTYVRKDSSTFIGEVNSVILPGDDPEYLVIIRDITERKRSEEALRRSEERYRELVQKAGSAIVRWRPDGTITFFNEYAQAFFGYSAEEVVGKPASIFVPEKDTSGKDLSGLIDDILTHPDRYSSHVNENICRNGRRAWIAWANMPVFDENGNFVEIFSVGTDITHQKHIEDELQELNKTLENRVRERTRKLNDSVRQLQRLAHQLTQAEDLERRRLAELLHDDIQQLLVASKMHLGGLPPQIGDARIARAAEMTRALLEEAIAKTRNLSHELRPPVMSERGMVAALRWLCAQMKSKYNLNVGLVADTDVEVADSIKIFMFRAAQELLFNIVKHAQVTEAEMHLNQIDRMIRLMVADSGRGFDPGQIGPSGAAVTGFGLFSIRERIGLLGGWLDIDSAPGKGSRFVMHIPADAG